MGSTQLPFVNESLSEIAAEDIDIEMVSSIYEERAAQRAQIDLFMRIFLEMTTVFVVINICANIMIAYLILRFKKLRMNKSNLFMLNFNVLDSVLTILFPVTLRPPLHLINLWRFLCFSQLVMILGSIIMVTFVAIGWYLKTYYPQRGVRFDKRVGVIIACMYVFIGFCIGMSVEPYYHPYLFPYMTIAVLILFVHYIVFMLVINVLHFVKKNKLGPNVRVKTYPLILANVFFLSKLPFLISDIVLIIFINNSTTYPVPSIGLLVTVCITGVLALMQGVYFLIVLYVFGEDYRVFFRYVFSCKRLRYNEERLDSSAVYRWQLIMNAELLDIIIRK